MTRRIIMIETVPSILLLVAGLLSCAFANPKGYGDYDGAYDDLGDYGHHHNIVPVKKVVEYYHKPKYAFGYEVDGLDHYFNELSHGRWEIRDGDVTQGQYRVLLPDGRIQIVSYIADKFGYRPTIQYINKGVLPPPPPAYSNVQIPAQFIEPQHPIVKSPEIILPSPSPYLDPYPVKVSPVGVLGGGPGGFSGYPQYGAGYGYGGYGYGDPFLALGSSNNQQSGQAKVAKKRALLYDRTLFRKDVERPRRASKRQVKQVIIKEQPKNSTSSN